MQKRPVYAVPGKDIEISAASPRVAVSAMGRTEAELLQSVERIAASADADCIEVRLDYLDRGRTPEEIAELSWVMEEAVKRAGSKLVIATVRTRKEGGEAAFSDAEYAALIAGLLTRRVADFIDIEVSNPDSVLRQLVARAHDQRVGVIMSSHSFSGTPSEEAMLFTLTREEELGADICKIAVMPKSARDVAVLLKVTAEASGLIRVPLLTISMGSLGSVSRVSGAVFGSALTFAGIGAVSAPGQLSAADAVSCMRILQP